MVRTCNQHIVYISKVNVNSYVTLNAIYVVTQNWFVTVMLNVKVKRFFNIYTICVQNGSCRNYRVNM